MVRCPVCGKDYSNSTALLKHVRLKSKYDKAHEKLWNEFQEFLNNWNGASNDEYMGKTDLFREFLRSRRV